LIEYLLDRLSTVEGEDGQTMAEYAVVLGVITLAVVAALTTLSGSISTYLGQVTSKI
jgi:Flp pilus assembly pilin Flp